MMRHAIFMLTVLCVVAVFHTTPVLAQSSGSFSASYSAIKCQINDTNGTLSGNIAQKSLPEVTAKGSSGSGVALVITPSLVTGLYTNNKLNQTNATTGSTQNVGVKVKVEIDGSTQ